MVCVIYPSGRAADIRSAIEGLEARVGMSVDLVADTELTDRSVSPRGPIILGTPTLPKIVRDTPAPLVILEPAALAGAGLAGPTRGVDYQSPEEGDPGRPLVGLRGGPAPIQPVAAHRAVGWAKPRKGAEILVHDLQAPDRAVAFAYPAKGPVGPRLALLVGFDGLPDLTVDGAAILSDWLIHAGATGRPEATGVPIEYSHTLWGHEYQRYVHEQVGKNISAALLRYASIVGVGGVLALGAAGWGYIELKIATDLSAEKEKLQDKIVGNLSGLVNERVATTLLTLSKVEEKVKARTETAIDEALDDKKVSERAQELVADIVDRKLDPKRIDKIVEEAVNKDANRQALIDAATEKLRSDRGIQKVILSAVRPQVFDDDDPAQRARAFQILVFFEDKDQLRETVRRILSEESNPESELYSIALTEYPHAGDATDAEILDAVLADLRSVTEPPDELIRAVQAFVSKFSDAHAAQVTRRLATGELAAPIADALVSVLGEIKGDGVVTAFVELAAVADDSVSELGWIGLAGLGDREVSKETRLAALRTLWPMARGEILGPNTDLTRRSFAAATAPDARVLEQHLALLEGTGDMSPQAARYLRSRVKPNGRLLLDDVDHVMRAVERVHEAGDISHVGYSALRLVIEGGDEIAGQLAGILTMGGTGRASFRSLLERFRATGELKEQAYRFLQRAALREFRDEPDLAADLRDRLETVRRFDDVSDRAYGELSASLRMMERSRSAAVDREQIDREQIERVLSDLGGNSVFSLILAPDLTAAMRSGDAGEARRLLSRARGLLPPDAYRRLEAAIGVPEPAESDELKATLVMLLEHLVQIERSLVARPESARPIVDATLKNAVIAWLLPPPTQSETWTQLLSDLSLVETDGSTDNNARLLTVFSQRARTTLGPDVEHSAYDPLVRAVLEQPLWSGNEPLADVLAHSVEHCPAGVLRDHVRAVLRTGASDPETKPRGQNLAVRGLAAALRRLNGGDRPLVYAGLVADLGLVRAPAAQKRLFLEGLQQALATDRRPWLAVMRGAKEAIEGPPAEAGKALDFTQLVLDVSLDTPDRATEERDRIVAAIEDSGLAAALARAAEQGDGDGRRAQRLLQRLVERVPWFDGLGDVHEIANDGFAQDVPAQSVQAGLWYALPAIETHDYWLRLPDDDVGKAEIAVVDRDHHRVVRRETLSAGRPVELFEREAHFVRVRASAGGTAVPPKRILAQVRDKPAPLEIGETKEEAKPVETGKRYRGRFEGLAHVKFGVEAGGHYVIETSHLSAGAETDLKLLAEDDTVLAGNLGRDGGPGATIDWIATDQRTVLLQIAGRAGRFDLVVKDAGIENLAALQPAPRERARAARLAEYGKIVPVQLEEGADFGWLSYPFASGVLYRLEANSVIEIREGDDGPSRQLVPRLHETGAFLGRPHFFQSTRGAEYGLRIQRPRLHSVAKLRISEVERPAGLQSAADEAGARELPPLSLAEPPEEGWLVSLAGPTSFLPIDLKRDVDYSLHVLPTVAGTALKTQIVPLDDAAADVIEAGSDARPYRFKVNRDGRYLLRLEPKAEGGTGELVHVIAEPAGRTGG